eukprot:15083389-Alexandrium_andersonii.AAC.1
MWKGGRLVRVSPVGAACSGRLRVKGGPAGFPLVCLRSCSVPPEHFALRASLAQVASCTGQRVLSH